MATLVVSTATGLGIWFSGLARAVHHALIRAARAKAAADLARLGYHREAQNLIDENRLEN